MVNNVTSENRVNTPHILKSKKQDCEMKKGFQKLCGIINKF